MRAWTDIRQVPVNAWFAVAQDGDQREYFKIHHINMEMTVPVIHFTSDYILPVSLTTLAQGLIYSHDLKEWKPCGLPTECPECGYENLGYCIPEPETPDGWFCTRCKAPHVEGMKKYADPYTRAKMGVPHTKPGLRQAGGGGNGDPEGRS